MFDVQRELSDAQGRVVDERQSIELGRRLGATWVVGGAVQRLGDRVRLTAQTIAVDEGRSVSTVKIDGRMDEIFELQDRLVEELVRQGLQRELRAEREAGHRRGRRCTRGLRGLLARHAQPAHGDRRNRSSARLRCSSRRWRSSPATSRPSSRWAARCSCAGRSCRCRTCSSGARRCSRRRWPWRRRAPRRTCVSGRRWSAWARPTPPRPRSAKGWSSSPTAPSRMAQLARLLWLGRARIDDAIAHFHRPPTLAPQAGYTYLQLALLYALNGDLDAAERHAREAVDLQQRAMSGTQGLIVVGAHTRLGYVHYLRGQYDDAIRRVPPRAQFPDARPITRCAIGRSSRCNQKLAAAYFRLGAEDGSPHLRQRRHRGVRSPSRRRGRRPVHALLPGHAARAARRRRAGAAPTSSGRCGSWARSPAGGCRAIPTSRPCSPTPPSPRP